MEGRKCAKCSALVILGISTLFIFLPKVGSRLTTGLPTQTRVRRQILQPNVRKSLMEPNYQQFTELYLKFVADISAFKGYEQIYILMKETKNCEGFKRILADLGVECGDDDDILKGMKLGAIFYFHFLNSSSFPPRELLIPYDSNRPVFLLTCNVSKDEVGDFVDFKGSYKWTLVSGNVGQEIFYLQDVYGFVRDAPITQYIGEWSESGGVRIDTELALGPTDFQGRTLMITTVAGPPYVFVDKFKNEVKGRGYLPDILHTVSLQLNFTYKVMTPLDNKFGNIEANGEWNGMVGMLQRLEAEIAMMSFSLTASRKTVMDFSPPVEYSSVRLLIRRDWQNAELKWSAYLRPLGADVWLTIPIFLVIGVITLAIFEYWNILKITPFTSAWLLTSCFILQGQDEHSVIKVTPYRIVLGTFWILSVVVYACYTARLTSFLAASNENLPVNSLLQAVKNRNWKVGLVKSSAFVDRIKESRVEVLRALSQRITEDSSALVETFQDGMDRVFKERYIFFTSELIPAFLIRQNCSYTWLPDKYFSGFGYMGYQKGLPYAPVISQRVAEIRQSGQMRRLFTKWWGTDSVCFTNSGNSFLGMSLYETGTAFLILIFGTSLAITLIVAEFCAKRRVDSNIDKQDVSKTKINQLESKLVDSMQHFSYKSGFSFYGK